MIALKKHLIEIITKILKAVSASLSKEVNKKYRTDKIKQQQKAKSPKMKDKFYRCGKCRIIIEISKLKWEWCKTGRYSRCPACGVKIIKQSHPDGYDRNSNKPYIKPNPFGRPIKRPDRKK